MKADIENSYRFYKIVRAVVRNEEDLFNYVPEYNEIDIVFAKNKQHALKRNLYHSWKINTYNVERDFRNWQYVSIHVYKKDWSFWVKVSELISFNQLEHLGFFIK
jgi:hypothetical protein